MAFRGPTALQPRRLLSLGVRLPEGYGGVKRVRRKREPWYAPPPPPAVAVFVCRGCGAVLTTPLRRLDDAAALCEKELAPLVPEGHYWPVAAGHPKAEYGFQNAVVLVTDFTGHFAVRTDALVGIGGHTDRARWVGCCGPSGLGGPNRVCACGRSVGTERADCQYAVAVYLDPAAVRAVEPEAEPDGAPDRGGSR
jgi:hypothetical protein